MLQLTSGKRLPPCERAAVSQAYHLSSDALCPTPDRLPALFLALDKPTLLLLQRLCLATSTPFRPCTSHVLMCVNDLSP